MKRVIAASENREYLRHKATEAMNAVDVVIRQLSHYEHDANIEPALNRAKEVLYDLAYK